MKRLRRNFGLIAISLLGLFASGCSNEAGMQLRDAAIGGAATFIEQQTLELLTNWFGQDAAP